MVPGLSVLELSGTTEVGALVNLNLAWGLPGVSRGGVAGPLSVRLGRPLRVRLHGASWACSGQAGFLIRPFVAPEQPTCSLCWGQLCVFTSEGPDSWGLTPPPNQPHMGSSHPGSHVCVPEVLFLAVQVLCQDPCQGCTAFSCALCQDPCQGCTAFICAPGVGGKGAGRGLQVEVAQARILFERGLSRG